MEYEFEWEDAFLILVIAALVCAAAIGFAAIAGNHEVRSYYIAAPATKSASVTCVGANAQWSEDDIVFCASDPQAAINFMREANAALSKGESK